MNGNYDSPLWILCLSLVPDDTEIALSAMGFCARYISPTLIVNNAEQGNACIDKILLRIHNNASLARRITRHTD